MNNSDPSILGGGGFIMETHQIILGVKNKNIRG